MKFSTMLPGHRVVAHLDQDLVGWLTTVNAQHQPQSSAIWFLRDGDDIIVDSRPGATRGSCLHGQVWRRDGEAGVNPRGVRSGRFQSAIRTVLTRIRAW